MGTIGKILVEGLKVIDPTIKGVDLIAALAEYFNNKNIEKLDEINERLLNDEATDYEKEKILNGGIDPEDYLSFIRAAVNDDETKKTTNYITLYRNILNGRIKDGKGRLYKMLKDLPYSAVELLPKIYIHKHYKVQNKTLQNYLKQLINDDNLSFEINLLIQYGILKNEQLTRENITNEFAITLSPSFDNIVKSFFKKNELVPRSQKIRIWNKKTFLFADLDNITNFNYVENLLQSMSINVLNKNLFALDSYIPLEVDNIVCLLNNKIIPDKAIKILEEYSKIYEVHKICLDEIVEDQLHKIQGNLILIKKEDKESEQFFLSKFDIHPLDLF